MPAWPRLSLVGSGQVGMTVGLLLAGVALVVRLRRASGEERQQLRWIAAAVALVAATLMAIVVHNLARGGNVPADPPARCGAVGCRPGRPGGHGRSRCCGTGCTTSTW